MRTQRPDRRLEVVAAYVVEVDVDPVGSELGQSLARFLLAVVEDPVEAELAEPGELLLGSGAADDTATGERGHLSGCASHRACRAGDEHRLALLRPAEGEDPVPRREPRHAQHAERGRHGRGVGIEPPQRRAVGERPLAPAQLVEHPVALGIAGVARGGDAADGSARHRLSERERRYVRADVVHARAHVRIDREVGVPDEHLALGRVGDRRLGDLEEILVGEAPRTRDETNLT